MENEIRENNGLKDVNLLICLILFCFLQFLQVFALMPPKKGYEYYNPLLQNVCTSSAIDKI
ncbi:MAG: hypothetical protein A2275_06075 [Bacteroidetes bacterium RIFOXYA12_FULL_35_11]|nr:MAG: hypothetical protein A2X01_01640 [Bacteroidetes bacterium GWF2_35_48]OFY74185.1 MAG: hypothetical protein A2275_06075 [Bacteroidetes bacterium RIFOXYA12_FULL_35_11]OFY96355.1 MAG: hypothetical protein A2491_03195 [Bacteroidetes bacterium RIFOXYC12_FULL_35_7]OFY96747.1 MAG: hypothetical protein A2309_00950 [Bacteroidetes bacterium RIFOXYB2_FULL_35_7]HBX53755.1 hypothetical protein [Bacteroidales bacterium]